MQFGSGNFLQVLLKGVFDYTIAVYSYTYPILVVVSNPPLMHQYMTFLRRFKPKIKPIKSSRSEQLFDSRKKLMNLRTSNGCQMVFSVDQEKEIYFHKLEEIWAANIPDAYQGYRGNRYLIWLSSGHFLMQKNKEKCKNVFSRAGNRTPALRVRVSNPSH